MEKRDGVRFWSVLLVVVAVVFPGLCFAGDGYYGPAPEGRPQAGAPTIGVQRDKDKTAYTIGGSPRRNGSYETDRAWEMLNNMIIDARGTHGKRPDNNR